MAAGALCVSGETAPARRHTRRRYGPRHDLRVAIVTGAGHHVQRTTSMATAASAIAALAIRPESVDIGVAVNLPVAACRETMAIMAALMAAMIGPATMPSTTTLRHSVLIGQAGAGSPEQRDRPHLEAGPWPTPCSMPDRPAMPGNARPMTESL